MNKEFWRGRRVLITGHTGFKGGWLTLLLKSYGADITGYSLAPNTEPSLFYLADIANGIDSVIGDIRDAVAVKEIFIKKSPEIIFHLASQPLVRRSYVDPVETYSTNIMGLINTLEAARVLGSVKAMINVTSDKCYENFEWVWGYRENDRMGGFDPYSSSKGCAELITSAYRRSFFSNTNETGASKLALASARAGNVIGGGDWSLDRLVPDLIRGASEKIPVKIRKPESIRPWQHVLDPLYGYIILAEKLTEAVNKNIFASAWNFGPNFQDSKPVSWIVNEFSKLIQSEYACEFPSSAADPEPHEANYLKLDCSKASETLGWIPQWSLNTAIQETAKWYRAYLDKKDMRIETISQINKYLSDVDAAKKKQRI